MTDRPIIFSAPMIRAILSGSKTMTRRLATSPLRKCQPGDRLWVKEGWVDEHPLAIQSGRYSQEGRAGIPGPPPVKYRTIYRADGDPLQIWRTYDDHPYYTLSGPNDAIDAKHPTVCSNYNRPDGKGIAWHNALFMFRWASRITLEVAAVKIERLQDITEEDARDEGAQAAIAGRSGWSDPIYSFRTGFVRLWNELHGESAWLSNPEVVAISFTNPLAGDTGLSLTHKL